MSVEENKSHPHVAFAAVRTDEDDEVANIVLPLAMDHHIMTSPSSGDAEEEDIIMPKQPFLRPVRVSVVSRASLTSRPSASSLVASVSRINLELYPESGSYMADKLGQSLNKNPQVAKKAYFITQVLAAISVSMGSMAVGFSAAYTSPALASMSEANSTLNVTEEQKSWIGSLMPLSALTGSILGGYLIGALGRKMVILICGPPFIAAYILIGSASNIWMIYVGRAISGVCVGLLSLTLPVYLSETVQADIRGTLALLPTTFGNGGILLCFLIGSYVNWSWLAYIGSIIPLIFTLMMIFVPETPRWYVSKGRDEEARHSLEWLRGTYADVDFELDEIQTNYDDAMRQSGSIRDLFTKRYLRPFFLCVGYMFFQQFSGINAVIFYTVDIFIMAGSTLDGNLCTIIMGIVNLLATLVANVLIDRLGRKKLIILSGLLVVVSLDALGGYFLLKSWEVEDTKWTTVAEVFGWVPLASLVIYVFAFSIGWGPIPWLFMGEALPAKVRGPAASVVTSFNWSCTFLITKTFQGMLIELGQSTVFFLFSAIMAAGFFFTIFAIPETKGKSLEEIETLLSGKPRPRVRKISNMSGVIIMK